MPSRSASGMKVEPPSSQRIAGLVPCGWIGISALASIGWSEVMSAAISASLGARNRAAIGRRMP